MLFPLYEEGRRGLSRLERPRAEHCLAQRGVAWPRALPKPRLHWCGAGRLVGMVPVLVLPSLLRLSDSSRRAGTSRVHPAVRTAGGAGAGGSAVRPAGSAGSRVLLVLLPECQGLLPDGANLS